MITITFPDLTPEQVRAIVATYEQVTGKATAAPLVRTTTVQPTQPSTVQPVQPTQPTTTVPQASSPSTVDAFGVPYNPAIHAVTTGPTGGKTQDGAWKMKKNVNRADFDSWARTHRAAAAAPASQPTAAQVNAQFGAPPVTTAGNAFTQPVTPGAAFGAAPAAPPAVSYEIFVAKCNDMMRAGTLTNEVINTVKTEIGCQDETAINTDPTVRASAYQVLLRIEREKALAPA